MPQKKLQLSQITLNSTLYFQREPKSFAQLVFGNKHNLDFSFTKGILYHVTMIFDAEKMKQHIHIPL